MKKIAIISLVVSTTVFAMAAETTNVTAIIKGRRLEFSSDDRAQLVQKSCNLLASCGYMEAKPKWGAPAEPQRIADAQKQSHLHVCSPAPTRLRFPRKKLQCRSARWSSACHWPRRDLVRTDDGVQYFAMFDPLSVKSCRSS